MPFDSEAQVPPVREPMFKAPWPALALCVVIIGGYALQGAVGGDAVIARYAFSPIDLQDGRWPLLFTALFLHGSWPHALMNGAFALAFATPLARFFGLRLRDGAAFAVFYLACGALANVGYAVLHAGEHGLLVGASGAVSGLMGAASRLIAGRGAVGPILSRPVLGMGGAWLAINLLIALFGFAPGAGDATVAWEAHVAGFIAGVLLLGPFAAALRRR
ncbi:rhomboid family intramembrane serine protease [Phenylobacterium sp.]|uniref:rhomboid family intramembrane serine protease n=1 Tax=Phenylobacterium sp. TaxID=1871053 RepID=UPI002736A72C|nr:rhomboid family intramembrane serine protease [Phenylobacterium sp.]MDP3660586.1 rhomboid family intramembrane serine protease [Phenylobacterium sp.]